MRLISSMNAATVAALAGNAVRTCSRHQVLNTCTSDLSARSVLRLNAPRAASK